MAAENREWISSCPSSAESIPRISEIQSVFQWCGLPKVKDYLSKGEFTKSISVLSWRGKDQVGLGYHFWGCHDMMSRGKCPALLPSIGISEKQVGRAVVVGCPRLPLRVVPDLAAVPPAMGTASGGGQRRQKESEKGTWVVVLGNLGVYCGVFKCGSSWSKTVELFYEGQKYLIAEVSVPKCISGEWVRPTSDHNLERVPLRVAQMAFSVHSTIIFPGIAGTGEDMGFPMETQPSMHVALKETCSNLLNWSSW